MPITPRNGKKTLRSARNVNLVVTAMRNLRDENGCTVGNIVGYISDYCDRPAPKREVIAALKRGLEFGIVDRKRGRYFLQTDDKNIEDKKRGNRPKLLTDDEGSEVAVEQRRTSKPAKLKKSTRVGKGKDGRRKKGRKAALKKSKKARISRAIRPYKLDDFYRNPKSRPSVDSSLESMDYFQGGDTYKY
ncbi:uncharacterized protein LOC107040155 [Diachasma alloeum]|uniref:uncharacterized protein LOC107040155 n=1 Tax=Diachasma alloeum TaxID=454923 RepID=UPI0007382D68|nr:uncharacterized protein LOC107040155 [Diachasma alloeum]